TLGTISCLVPRISVTHVDREPECAQITARQRHRGQVTLPGFELEAKRRESDDADGLVRWWLSWVGGVPPGKCRREAPTGARPVVGGDPRRERPIRVGQHNGFGPRSPDERDIYGRRIAEAEVEACVGHVCSIAR